MRDMEEVLEYTIEHPEVIHNQTFGMLNAVYSKKKIPKVISIFIIRLTDDDELDEATLTVESHEWVMALEMGLKFYEEREEYEMCSKVKELLNKIKNQ